MFLRRSDINPVPDFFDRYIHLIDDITLSEALRITSDVFSVISDRLEQLQDTVYAPGKWTAKDILQHCIDTERIMSYRALRFARNDDTPLPGFDESWYARHTTASDRSVPDLIDEFSHVRQSSIALFRNLDEEMLRRRGTCFNREVQVLALGFVIAGHPLHHSKVLEERYFPFLRSY